MSSFNYYYYYPRITQGFAFLDKRWLLFFKPRITCDQAPKTKRKEGPPDCRLNSSQRLTRKLKYDKKTIMDSIVIDQTFLACMFCFPISDPVMVPQRTVSFNVVFCTCTHMSGCMHNYIKDKFPEERWENKTNKLMTPSCIRDSVSLLKERILNFYVININFT